jgi:hypothetical protein
MAKTTTRKRATVQRQGRRVMPTPRRVSRRTMGPTQLTVGELIAAAYDTAGGERREVLKLVTSQQMSRALGRRIVVVG